MTQQIRDILVYNGKRYSLRQELLVNYFTEFPERKPKSSSILTSCWRGHKATFEIQKNELIIIGFWLVEQGESMELITELFPNNKYDWFSGFIRIDDFRDEYDEENNQEAVYELLEIVNGNLKTHWKLNYDDFQTLKQRLFSGFKHTEAYLQLFAYWRKNSPRMTDEKIDAAILNDIIRKVCEL